MNHIVLSLLFLACLAPIPATPQKRVPPGIREAQDYEAAHPLEPPTVRPPRIDPLELQRQADELSILAQTIPGDIDRAHRGLLPADLVEKLKKIEKLSKHLRNGLSRQ